MLRPRNYRNQLPVAKPKPVHFRIIFWGADLICNDKLESMMNTKLDKRSSARHPLRIDVDIYNKGSYLGRGMTRDLQIDGAFISRCHGEIHQNDILELRLFLNEDEQKPVCLRAMVVRNADDGIGVLFSYGAMEYRHLFSAIYRDRERFAHKKVFRAMWCS